MDTDIIGLWPFCSLWRKFLHFCAGPYIGRISRRRFGGVKWQQGVKPSSENMPFL